LEIVLLDREKAFIIGVMRTLIAVGFIENVNVFFFVNDMRLLIFGNRLVNVPFDKRFF